MNPQSLIPNPELAADYEVYQATEGDTPTTGQRILAADSRRVRAHLFATLTALNDTNTVISLCIKRGALYVAFASLTLHAPNITLTIEEHGPILIEEIWVKSVANDAPVNGVAVRKV